MKTAEDIRLLQMQHRVENWVLKEIEKFAIKHPTENTWTKYIYDREEYLAPSDIEWLRKAGFEVECQEREGNYQESTCDCQVLTVSW